MRKALITLLVAGSAVVGAASAASAQNIYFGFGTGGGWQPNHHYSDRGYYPRHRYYDGGYRPRYYRPYRAYSYSDCYYRKFRKFNRHRGVWVVRRVRVCD